MMSEEEVVKIRGLLMAKGFPPWKIAAKFEVTLPAIYQAISGDSRSDRIQKFISEEIGYWPYPWKLGVARVRPE